MDIDEFLYVDSWFEDEYKNKSQDRYFTFKAALNLFLQNGGMNIVETGTTRQLNDWGAGYSTYLFGAVAALFEKHVWTVDISRENIEVCKKVTEDFCDYITYKVDDSHNFLAGFDHSIDLLYLDSVDFPLDGSDPTGCQLHQLKEFKLAESLLSDRAIVLLDDNHFLGGGKTKLTKNYLREKGWRCVLDYQQSLFIR
jgi:hypothetical protein